MNKFWKFFFLQFQHISTKITWKRSLFVSLKNFEVFIWFHRNFAEVIWHSIKFLSFYCLCQQAAFLCRRRLVEKGLISVTHFTFILSCLNQKLDRFMIKLVYFFFKKSQKWKNHYFSKSLLFEFSFTIFVILCKKWVN